MCQRTEDKREKTRDLKEEEVLATTVLLLCLACLSRGSGGSLFGKSVVVAVAFPRRSPTLYVPLIHSLIGL